MAHQSGFSTTTTTIQPLTIFHETEILTNIQRLHSASIDEMLNVEKVFNAALICTGLDRFTRIDSGLFFLFLRFSLVSENTQNNIKSKRTKIHSYSSNYEWLVFGFIACAKYS